MIAYEEDSSILSIYESLICNEFLEVGPVCNIVWILQRLVGLPVFCGASACSPRRAWLWCLYP